MPKIAIIDTYYPEFLNSIQIGLTGYKSELDRLLGMGFGTADFYSRNLKKFGWETMDIIGNARVLQRQWLTESGRSGAPSDQTIVEQQIKTFAPDVIFMQDLSFFSGPTLEELRSRHVLAGQCSCPIPAISRTQPFHVLFTSFPHYVDKFKETGARAEYLPLAFEPHMSFLEVSRVLDVTFIGGVGKNLHWRKGTEVLEAVAETFGKRFHWYGYGFNNLSAHSPLRACFRGPAWGRKMYQIYNESKIVVNRHGEVAAGFANNLRLYEATGSGAMVITEMAPNLPELFPPRTIETYFGAGDLCRTIDYYLAHDEERNYVASRGRNHTLMNHTYEKRMARVSEVLMECLKSRRIIKN